MDLSQQTRSSTTASACCRRPSLVHSSCMRQSPVPPSSRYSAMCCTFWTRLFGDTRRIRNFEKNGVQPRPGPLLVPQLIFGFIVCPFHSFSLSRPPIPFPRQFVSYKKRRASFACYTWVKIYLDRRRKSTSHVPSLAISCNKLNTIRHTSEIVSQKG